MARAHELAVDYQKQRSEVIEEIFKDTMPPKRTVESASKEPEIDPRKVDESTGS